MKRADIKPGVIYAKTGALTYGREPNQNQAVRVRFLEPLVPHVRVTTYEVVPNRPDSRFKHMWQRVTEEFVPATRVGNAVRTDLGVPRSATAEDRPLGHTQRSYRAIPNVLLAEASLDGETWSKQLVAPAEVHRTWDEWKAMRAEQQAKLDAQAVARIPIELDSHARQLVYWAKKKARTDLEQMHDPDTLRTPAGQQLLRTYVAATVQEALRDAGVELDLPASRKVD